LKTDFNIRVSFVNTTFIVLKIEILPQMTIESSNKEEP